MKKLIIIQTVAPDYRAILFEKINNYLQGNFDLYAGDSYFQSTIVSYPSIKRRQLKNYFLFNRKLLFQIGLWHLILKDCPIIIELNPRILSNWIFLFVRRIICKDIYVWGHAWGRKGINSNTDFLRSFMRNLSSGVIVYTNKQKSELELKMPQKKIYSAPNSLLSASKMVFETNNSKRKNIISVCRLVSQKKVLLLVKAFASGLDRIPKDINLIIIGDGDEKEQIKSFVNMNSLTQRVKLLGHISDYNILRKLYAEAYFSVSFGYVGLSVTQSFGFGVPMLVSRDENHSPEIEAVISGKNAVLFNTNDEIDFIKKILQVYKNREYWDNERKAIVEFCKKNYSIESMAKVLVNL